MVLFWALGLTLSGARTLAQPRTACNWPAIRLPMGLAVDEAYGAFAYVRCRPEADAPLDAEREFAKCEPTL
jgi:hypothetical protein